MSNKLRVIVIESPTAHFSSVFTGGMMRAHREAKENNCELDISFFKPICLDREQTLQEAVLREVKSALSEAPHIVIPVGVIASNTVKKEVSKLRNKPFILIAGVSNSNKLGLIHSHETPGELVSAVSLEKVDWLYPIQEILKSYPDMKKVLIPHNKTELAGRVGQIIEQVTVFLKNKNIKVDTLSTQKTNLREVAADIEQAITNQDSVFFLAGDRTSESYEHIAKTCDKKGITLIAPGMNVHLKGATLGFSSDIDLLGSATYERALEIGNLMMSAPPRDFQNMQFPVKRIPNNFKVYASEVFKKKGGAALVVDLITLSEEDPDATLDDPLQQYAEPEEYTGVPRFNIQMLCPKSPISTEIYRTSYFQKREMEEYIEYELFKIDLPEIDDKTFEKRVTDEVSKILSYHTNEDQLDTDAFLVYGYKTAKLTHALCKSAGVDLPIICITDKKHHTQAPEDTPVLGRFFIDPQKNEMKPRILHLFKTVLYKMLVEKQSLSQHEYRVDESVQQEVAG